MSFGLLNLLWTMLRTGRTPALPDAVLDPCLGDLRASALRAQLASGNFAVVEAQFAGTNDVDCLAHWVMAAAAHDEPPGWLDQWVRDFPQSPWAKLVQGQQATRWAWAARSSAVASDVNASAWPMFLQRLGLAETALEAAAKLLPGHPLASGLVITVLMGMQAPPEQIAATFDQAVENAPTFVRAHLAMLTALSGKWGGDNAAMLDFARRRAALFAALKMLIPLAHLEVYFAQPSTQERRDYGKHPAVRQEVLSAFTAFQRCEDDVARRIGANFFAFMLTAMGESRARDAFALTQGQLTPVPWGYLGDPVERYRHFRERAQ